DFWLREDGKAIAIAADEGIALRRIIGDQEPLWSPANVAPPEIFNTSNDWTRVTSSRNGAFLAAKNEAGNIGIWRLDTGQPVPRQPPKLGSQASALALATDGHIAITTTNGEILWWNSKDGTTDGRLRLPDSAGAVAVSPDGGTV